MKKWLIGSGIVAIAALTVLYFVTAPTDSEMIRQAVDDSALASSEGRPSALLDHLSRNLSYNGQAVSDRSEISSYVRLYKPEITFDQYEPVISGDAAVVRTSARVKFNSPALNFDQTIPDVEVKLARENGVRWLVLPGKKWRITEVTVPDLAAIPGLNE